MAADIKTHRCRPGVMNHCPDGYIEEIKNLCENGPVDTMRTCNGIFRNGFCALCWELPLLKSLDPYSVEFLTYMESREQTACDWTDTPTEATPSYNLTRYRQLLTLQPQLQTHDKPELLLSDVAEQKADDIILSLTNDLQTKYAYATTINSTKPIKAWDLGSLRCHSGFDNVCHNFIRFPDRGCGGPGCGASSVEDILNDACIQLDNTTSKIYNQTEIEAVRKNSHFTRPLAVYEKYYGSRRLGDYFNPYRIAPWGLHCE